VTSTGGYIEDAANLDGVHGDHAGEWATGCLLGLDLLVCLSHSLYFFVP
jgi:hypothetical protein